MTSATGEKQGDMAGRNGDQARQALVSIGIPTYNRAGTLRRAVESALTQSYPNIEVVVCDDGSSDATESVCRELAAQDERVRYIRSPANVGLAANHNRLFAELRGEHAMLLSDDDWLAPDYVQACLDRLRASPDLVLVAGIARYVSEGDEAREGLALVLDQPTASRRVRAYLREVDENGLMYGVMPRAALERASPMRDVLGNDWLLVMDLLAQGKALTIRETSIFRERGGASAGFLKLASTLRAPRWQARVPHLVIAWNVLAGICRRDGPYSSLATRDRLALALTAPWAAIRWRSLAWHMLAPVLGPLRSGKPGSQSPG